MRLVCAMLLAALANAAAPVTLVLQFENAYSPESLDAMKREVASIVAGSGIQVDWRMLSEVQPAETFENLVVVRFKGACHMEPVPYLMDERGYYAFTHVSDGGVLPFSEVECDKIGNSIRPLMSKSQWRQRDTVLGRALGRVLAHELYHMLAKSQQHAESGVTRSALSPSQLISDKLRMTRADLAKLRQ
ncbi:MAG TPA: hypothetical protein VMT15_05100 [Bryobacteraceae bacterium]|nr:hypothetical protein [Bryobacteraceae bacterium]